MRKNVVLLLALLGSIPSAFAEPCGNIDWIGICEDDVIKFCSDEESENGELLVDDCKTQTGTDGQPKHCVLYPAPDGWMCEDQSVTSCGEVSYEGICNGSNVQYCDLDKGLITESCSQGCEYIDQQGHIVLESNGETKYPICKEKQCVYEEFDYSCSGDYLVMCGFEKRKIDIEPVEIASIVYADCKKEGPANEDPYVCKLISDTDGADCVSPDFEPCEDIDDTGKCIDELMVYCDYLKRGLVNETCTMGCAYYDQDGVAHDSRPDGEEWKADCKENHPAGGEDAGPGGEDSGPSDAEIDGSTETDGSVTDNDSTVADAEIDGSTETDGSVTDNDGSSTDEDSGQTDEDASDADGTVPADANTGDSTTADASTDSAVSTNDAATSKDDAATPKDDAGAEEDGGSDDGCSAAPHTNPGSWGFLPLLGAFLLRRRRNV